MSSKPTIQCNDKIPPGITFSTSFVEFSNGNDYPDIQFLNLTTPFNDKPLTPIVRAQIKPNSASKGVPYVLEVYNIVFLYENISTDELTFYIEQDPLIAGLVNFYISYGRTPSPTINLTPTPINFTIPTFFNPSSVQVFLWNDDPETSRGTLTTVKKS